MSFCVKNENHGRFILKQLPHFSMSQWRVLSWNPTPGCEGNAKESEKRYQIWNQTKLKASETKVELESDVVQTVANLKGNWKTVSKRVSAFFMNHLNGNSWIEVWEKTTFHLMGNTWDFEDNRYHSVNKIRLCIKSNWTKNKNFDEKKTKVSI